MTAITLSANDLVAAALLVVVDGALSLALGLGFHRPLWWSATRMVVQLLLVGWVLRVVFALAAPLVTLAVVSLMIAAAAREVAVRPEQRLRGLGNHLIGGAAVTGATLLAVLLALSTAVRPTPWYDAHHAIPLVGIVLGSVLNAASIALESMLDGVIRDRAAIEAQLALGATRFQALGRLVRGSIRRGLVPVINQMSAAGLITLPGIMTGQLLAGMDPGDTVRYQILLMFLLAGASALAALAAVYMVALRVTDDRHRLRLDRVLGRKRS